MKYTRTEPRNGYELITTVDDKGNYTQHIKWDDGKTDLKHKSTVQEMGWTDTQSFLRSRPNFVKEGENNGI